MNPKPFQSKVPEDFLYAMNSELSDYTDIDAHHYDEAVRMLTAYRLAIPTSGPMQNDEPNSLLVITG